MKKFVVMAIIAAGLVACNQDKMVKLSPAHAIEFESRFAGGRTRAAEPSYTQATLDKFNLWGFMDKTTIPIWQAEDVTRAEDGVWTYENVEYWLPGHSYYFAALAPMDSNNWSIDTSNGSTLGLGTLSFTNVDGSEDLLYAKEMMKTEETYAEMFANPTGAVKLNFEHALSMVKFEFQNGFPKSEVSLVVKNVAMEVPKTATIDLAAVEGKLMESGKWELGDDTAIINFGDVSEMTYDNKFQETALARMLIPTPAAHPYKVTFEVEVYVGGVFSSKFSKEAVVDNDDKPFEIGKAYKVFAKLTHDNLNLVPIEFTVTGVTGWVEESSESLDK